MIPTFLIKSSHYQNSNSTVFFNSFKLHVWSITQKSDFMDFKSHFIDFLLKSLLFLYILSVQKKCVYKAIFLSILEAKLTCWCSM